MEKANIIPLRKAETVEIKLDAQVNKHNFQELAVLRDKVFVGAEVHHVNQVSKSPLNRALMADATFKNTYLTLVENGKEVINKVPVNSFYPSNNSGKIKELGRIKADLANSYLTIPNSSSIVTGESFLITFYYEEPNEINCK